MLPVSFTYFNVATRKLKITYLVCFGGSHDIFISASLERSSTVLRKFALSIL